MPIDVRIEGRFNEVDPHGIAKLCSGDEGGQVPPRVSPSVFVVAMDCQLEDLSIAESARPGIRGR